MMVCHLSGDEPNVTIFTNGPSSEDPALKEAVDAAQSTGYIFDERIITELTRTPNEQKKVGRCPFRRRWKRTNGFID